MQTYDYIIVGGGSAGCVLAARLTEDPAIRVLLVEAGREPEGELLTVPSQWPGQFTTEWDWGFLSDPEPGFKEHRNYLPRGKTLGGSSSMNAMLYVRGDRRDYDEWASAGLDGWNYADVLGYFIKSERNSRGASEYHGAEGPMEVTDAVETNTITATWLEACAQAGHAIVDDFNGATREGAGYFQLTVDAEGHRVSTATAFLRPAWSRPNLQVLSDVLVSKVIIERGRATGIETMTRTAAQAYHCEREVLLSAGAYNSPQLLMLSGIGPAEDLRGLGIPVVADLPVGQGLQDHPGICVVVGTSAQSMHGAGSQANWAQWHKDHTGPLRSNLDEAGGFFRTDEALPTPDVEAYLLPAMVTPEGLSTSTQHAYSVAVQVLKPSSAGSVRLRSANPTAKPRIIHNHLTTRTDMDTLIAGLRLNLAILDQPAMKAISGGPIQYPAGASDEELADFIRSHGQSLYHPTSSCGMSRVVDNTLSVYGVGGLRVIDASVMPAIIRGNPNATVIMIAERASDLIKGS